MIPSVRIQISCSLVGWQIFVRKFVIESIKIFFYFGLAITPPVSPLATCLIRGVRKLNADWLTPRAVWRPRSDTLLERNTQVYLQSYAMFKVKLKMLSKSYFNALGYTYFIPSYFIVDRKNNINMVQTPSESWHLHVACVVYDQNCWLFFIS